MDTPTRDAALFGLSLVRQQIEKLVPAKIEEVEAPVLDLARIKEDARRALSVVIRTLCVRCGPGVNIDKRGFCWICGCPAIGDGLKAYVQDIRVLVEIPGLVKEIERLYGLRSTIDARFRLEGDDLHVKVEGPAHLEKEVAEKAVTVVELYFACAADEERLELRRQVAAQRAELADRRAFDDRLAVVAERLQSLSLGPAGGMLHEQAADALERLKGLAGTLESNAFRIRSVSVREEEHARAGAMEMAAKQITWAMRGVQLDAT